MSSTCICDDSANDRHESDEEKDAWPKPVVVPQHYEPYQENPARDGSPQPYTRPFGTETGFTFIPMSTSWFDVHSSSFTSYIGSTIRTVPSSFLHVLSTRWTIRQFNTPLDNMNTVVRFLSFTVALVAI